MGTRSSLVLLAMIAAALVLTMVPTAAQGPIFATIVDPRAAAVDSPTSYNISIAGGPTGSVNYTVTWYLTGPDLAGGAPLESSPATLSGTEPTFRMNITAPSKEETITLFVKISARSGATFENTTVEQPIVVVTPIVLGASFRNDASTAALNVTVRFYVDDASVGSRTIAKIAPNAVASTSFNYLPAGLAPGTHRVRVEADLDGNGVIDAARGEVVASDLFYKGTAGLSTGWTVLIGIAIFVPVFLLTVALRRRGRT